MHFCKQMWEINRIMAKIQVILPMSRDVAIPAHAVERLMDSADGNAALLYIYILSHSGELDLAAASKRLRIPEQDLMSALGSLESCGLVGKSEVVSVPERSDEIPEYSQRDVAEHMGSDSEFKYLVNFTEEKLGKLLSTVDLQVLLGIYSWLGLPVDVICLLITSSIDSARKHLGAGRIPTMRTIEKRAKEWVRAGVMTIGRAEEYLAEQEKLGSDKARIAKIVGISGRALSATENRYITEWLRLEIPDELIAAAYDKTVINTGERKWNYINKILMTWSERGFKTLDEVMSGERKAPASPSDEGDEGAAMRLRELNRLNRKKREE